MLRMDMEATHKFLTPEISCFLALCTTNFTLSDHTYSSVLHMIPCFSTQIQVPSTTPAQSLCFHDHITDHKEGSKVKVTPGLTKLKSTGKQHNASYLRMVEHLNSMGMTHYMPVRMAAIQKSTSNKHWRGCGEKGTLLHCWWECKLVQLLWRTVWRFL